MCKQVYWYHIDDDDIVGFSDLIHSTDSENIDVFLISNGGSPVSAERIVKQLRGKYKKIRYLVTGNAYSAATIMCLSANEIIMHSQGTLGPIDPQINGIPAYAILKSFEEVENRLKAEGPASLTAYMPLIAKYDLHLFNICRNAQKLSEELANQYLKDYMFSTKEKTNDEIQEIVKFFMNHELHKSHGRSIDRNIAKEKGLVIVKSEETPGLDLLLLSLFNQYQFFLAQSPFYKLFENSRGVNWGRANQQIQIPVSNVPTQ
ncbi:SDH family Clp fold serine proteinase [Breznakiellaceae bacterium SP9]